VWPNISSYRIALPLVDIYEKDSQVYYRFVEIRPSVATVPHFDIAFYGSRLISWLMDFGYDEIGHSVALANNGT